MDLKKKLKEVEKEYQQKVENLNKMREMVKSVEVDCVNMEGQIFILRELMQEQEQKAPKPDTDKK